MSFISFSCLVAWVRTSNTMLNKSGEKGHPCLVLDFRRGVLLIQTQVFSPDAQQNQSTGTGLWRRRVQYLLQGTKQGEWAMLKRPRLPGKDL